jgi:S1-C subfamily serine protease
LADSRRPLRRKLVRLLAEVRVPVSDLVAVVAQVQCRKAGVTVGFGTGFFYEHQGGLYLITNRHVLIDEAKNHRPDSITLRLHTDASDIRKNADLTLALYDGTGAPCWREHPQAGRTVDVVALPVHRTAIAPGFFTKSFSKANHIPDDVDIALGEDLQVIGYPLGFHDQVHNLPVIRSATLASIYPVPFEGHPFVLIDARLHSGTSGSPVMTKPTSILRKADGGIAMLAGSATFLLGVHSASVDIQGRDPSRDEPLGLNVAWFASLIPEILSARAA